MKIPSISEVETFLRDGGPIASTDLSKALGAKLNAANLRRRIIEEKMSVDAYIAAKHKQAKAAQTDLEKAAKQGFADPTRKQSMQPKPTAAAPPAESTTPHLDRFEKLSGAAASHFYQTHRREIITESNIRIEDRQALENEMNAVSDAIRKQRAHAVQEANRTGKPIVRKSLK